MEKEEMMTPEEEILPLLRERQLHALRRRIAELPAADIALLFLEMTAEEQLLVYRLLPKELAAEVLIEMTSDMQEALIGSFSDYELRAVMAELFSDDAADLIEEMPDRMVRRILASCPAEMRRSVNQLLNYPEDSAGSIMTTEYVRLKASMTVGEAFDHIREVAIDKETVYTCYVTDPKSRLIGLVTASKLMVSAPDMTVGEIMEENIIFASTHDEREAVARLFEKYGFLALPVTDSTEHLVGIITVDDAIDVLSEETEEDFAKMAAIIPGDEETPYLRRSAFSIFCARVPWLLLLMISATFTGMIITSFEAALAASVILTSFIPMLMGTAGNSSSQTSVTVIRALSVGEIAFRDLARVLFLELRVSALCAAALAAVNFGKVLLVDRLLLGNLDVTVPVALVVSLTLFIVVVLSKLVGALLPICAKKVGLDPAVMASPFITTVVDAVSLLIYFSVAVAILPI